MDITNFPEDLFENNYTDTSDLQIANYKVYNNQKIIVLKHFTL